LETLAAASKSRFNNNFARASRFFVHFFAIPARLRHESAYNFTFVEGEKNKTATFLFFISEL